MLIIANNYSFENAEKTTLTSAISAGATSISVKNNQGFSATTYIILGEIGTEKAEIVSISSTSGNNTLVISACKFAHSEGDPVTYARYNQVRFYMATTSSGTYNLQTTAAMEVDNTNLNTVWDDTDGLSTYYYKVSYYNDLTTLESDKSDAIPGSGISIDTVRYITDAILKEANDEDEAITTKNEILDWLNDCQADVKSRRRKWKFLYTRASGNRTASQSYYSISDTFGITNLDKIDQLLYNYTSGTTDLMYLLREIPLEEYRYLTEDQTLSENDQLEKWTWDEAMDYIRVYPTPDTSANTVFYLYYYKNFTELDSDGDTLEIPDTRIYKYYCLFQFYMKKDDLNKGDRYLTKYEQAIANLMRNERRTVGQPIGFKYQPDAERRYYKY